jgi:hypothetical protein
MDYLDLSTMPDFWPSDEDVPEDSDNAAEEKPVVRPPKLVPGKFGLVQGIEKMNDDIVMTPQLTSYANSLRSLVPFQVVPRLVINSGVRTAEAQARAMLKVLDKGGDAYFSELYKEAADELLLINPKDVSTWAPAIRGLYQRRVLNAKGHYGGGALDIGLEGLSDEAIEAIEKAVAALGAVNVLREKVPSLHLHIEIPLKPTAKVGAAFGAARRRKPTTHRYGSMSRQRNPYLHALMGDRLAMVLGLEPHPAMREFPRSSTRVNEIANELVERRASQYAGSANVLVGEIGQAFLGLDPFPASRGERPYRTTNVSAIGNALVEERAGQYGSFQRMPTTEGSTMGRPARGAGRMTWDAAAKLVQRLAARGISPSFTYKCGAFPANSLSYDEATESAWVTVAGPHVESARREAVAISQGLGAAKVEVRVRRGFKGSAEISFWPVSGSPVPEPGSRGKITPRIGELGVSSSPTYIPIDVPKVQSDEEFEAEMRKASDAYRADVENQREWAHDFGNRDDIELAETLDPEGYEGSVMAVLARYNHQWNKDRASYLTSAKAVQDAAVARSAAVKAGTYLVPGLKRGARGKSVEALQRVINSVVAWDKTPGAGGATPGLKSVAVDGDFGPGVEKAVRALQSARGLRVDGILTVPTIEWIRSIIAYAKLPVKVGGALNSSRFQRVVKRSGQT